MKGDFEDGCYRKSCTNMISDWYNHSTHKYYCRKCANQINKFNQEFKEQNGYNLCEKVNKPK